MKVNSYTDIEARDFPGIEGVTIRWLIGQKDEAPNFAMRVIEVEPGNSTPFHLHNYEHEVFVLSGEGIVRDEAGNDHPIGSGSVVYIKPNEEHGFFSRGEEPLRFICMVPHVDGLEPVDTAEVSDSNMC